MEPGPANNDDRSPGPFSRRSRYILVAEGSTQDLFYTAMLLHRFSYPVCTARNARQALDMVSVAMPALVVADFVLPGMSGLDLLRTLGSNDRTYDIPVILLLPQDFVGAEELSGELEDTVVLQKPVSLEDLFRAVQASIEPTPRTNIRIQTALPVSVNKVPLDGTRGECATHLSSQGMYVRTFKYYTPHEQINIQLDINGRTINADATILYARRFDDGPFAEPGIAVKFTRLMGEDREYIRRYIHERVTRGIVTEDA